MFKFFVLFCCGMIAVVGGRLIVNDDYLIFGGALISLGSYGFGYFTCKKSRD
ncbi:MAG: hypothetical protein OXF49_00550 [Candidatus Saccharibacteria bacterium]|nr:hypothetical protein [Candidatus Saccharibacteria bacterium]MCY4088613.1 hypothetical protein [Candidatus Saccharibacteria bacterium]